jgi:DtxR family Mn-dependent transcriptional regulator
MATGIAILTAALAVAVIWFFRERISDFSGRLGFWGHADRILCEDALKHLYKCDLDGEPCSLFSLAGQLNVSIDGAARIVTKLQERSLAKVQPGSFQLTNSGKEYALHVIRAHRLWERYLADRTGVAEVEWHGRAEKVEHKLSPQEADALWANLGQPTHDPHGDPLPTSQGSVDSLEGMMLIDAKAGQKARVVHIEDEPESVYSSLVELGVFPGMELQVLEVEPNRVRILLEGSEKELDALEASNVTLSLVSEDEIDFTETRRLSDLRPGEKGEVVLISRASRGIERRRFMDLGLLPGTLVTAELENPGGDPIAYRIRGALLALRREQAEHVLVSPVQNGDS